MSYVPPGVIRKYGLVAPSGATTSTAMSRLMTITCRSIIPLAGLNRML